MILKWARKVKHFYIRPIRVFLFHQVSNDFDAATMKAGDWTATDQFKHNIERLLEEYCFISLPNAHKKMRSDFFRFRKYAVLTSDDGWASLNNILPWLSEKEIPVTLFLNPCYFDGRHFRDNETERYLTYSDINALLQSFPEVSIASHGWEHVRATEQNEEEFRSSVLTSVKVLKTFPNFVPFFAYTYGSYNEMTDRVLRGCGLIPVLIDKNKNWKDSAVIHRELLDGMIL